MRVDHYAHGRPPAITASADGMGCRVEQVKFTNEDLTSENGRSEKPHKRLEAWQRAVDLVVNVYKATALIPSSERYALVDQMRRAAIRVPSNIAEGAARQTKREFAQLLHVARGSVSELDTQLEIAARPGYLKTDPREEMDASLRAIDSLLNGLLRSLRE